MSTEASSNAETRPPWALLDSCRKLLTRLEREGLDNEDIREARQRIAEAEDRDARIVTNAASSNASTPTPGAENVRDWLAFEKRRGPLPLPESLPPMRSIEALLGERDALLARNAELLAALEELVTAAEINDQSDPPSASDVDYLHSRLAAARAAIAKATEGSK